MRTASVSERDRYGKQQVVLSDPVTIAGSFLYAEDAERQQLGVGQLERGEQVLVLRFPGGQESLRGTLSSLSPEQRVFVEIGGNQWEIVRVQDTSPVFWAGFVVAVVKRATVS